MAQDAFTSTRPGIKLDGETRSDLQEALTGMVINLPLNGCAHAELTLTNWGTPDGEDAPDYLFSGIGLGASLRIEMGEASTRLFEGEITAVEEQYGEGAPTIALLLQDALHRLARRRQSRSYEDYSPDEIVRALAGDAGLKTDVQLSSLTDSWHQLNESDLAFLQRLTARFDIGLRLQDGMIRARPEEPDPDPVVLDAQDSALSVKLMVDLNHQPLSSRVQGYNPGTAEAVEHDSDSLAPEPPATDAASTLRELGWEGAEVVPQPVARSQAEAEAYASAHFHRQAKRFVQGDIVCQGEAELTSGREIRLEGVSPRLTGLYQVVHCVHRFDNQQGYQTHLKVNRADWSPAS